MRWFIINRKLQQVQVFDCLKEHQILLAGGDIEDIAANRES
jgi:hypothetical protein